MRVFCLFLNNLQVLGKSDSCHPCLIGKLFDLGPGEFGDENPETSADASFCADVSTKINCCLIHRLNGVDKTLNFLNPNASMSETPRAVLSVVII